MNIKEYNQNNYTEKVEIIDGIEVYYLSKRISLEYVTNDMTRDVINIMVDNPKIQLILNLVGEESLRRRYTHIFEEVREVIF